MLGAVANLHCKAVRKGRVGNDSGPDVPGGTSAEICWWQSGCRDAPSDGCTQQACGRVSSRLGSHSGCARFALPAPLSAAWSLLLYGPAAPSLAPVPFAGLKDSRGTGQQLQPGRVLRGQPGDILLLVYLRQGTSVLRLRNGPLFTSR